MATHRRIHRRHPQEAKRPAHPAPWRACTVSDAAHRWRWSRGSRPMAPARPARLREVPCALLPPGRFARTRAREYPMAMCAGFPCEPSPCRPSAGVESKRGPIRVRRPGPAREMHPPFSPQSVPDTDAHWLSRRLRGALSPGTSLRGSSSSAKAPGWIVRPAACSARSTRNSARAFRAWRNRRGREAPGRGRWIRNPAFSWRRTTSWRSATGTAWRWCF